MTLNNIFDMWNQIESPGINPQLWSLGMWKDARNITGEGTNLVGQAWYSHVGEKFDWYLSPAQKSSSSGSDVST